MIRRKQKTVTILNYVIVCGWALVIFILSNQPAAVSSGQSGVIVGHLQQAMPGVSTALLTFLVRKSAHIIAYFVLGVLMYRALRVSIRRWPARTVAGLALLRCSDRRDPSTLRARAQRRTARCDDRQHSGTSGSGAVWVDDASTTQEIRGYIAEF